MQRRGCIVAELNALLNRPLGDCALTFYEVESELVRGFQRTRFRVENYTRNVASAAAIERHLLNGHAASANDEADGVAASIQGKAPYNVAANVVLAHWMPSVYVGFLILHSADAASKEATTDCSRGIQREAPVTLATVKPPRDLRTKVPPVAEIKECTNG